MKPRTKTLYVVSDGRDKRTYRDYMVFSTLREAKKVARASLKDRYNTSLGCKVLAYLCASVFEMALGNKLPQKHFMKLTITIEEEKI